MNDFGDYMEPFEVETAEMTNTTTEGDTTGEAQKGDGKDEESKENSDVKPENEKSSDGGNKEMRFELFQFKNTPDAEDEIRAEHEAKFEELQNTAGTNNLGKPASGISA